MTLSPDILIVILQFVGLLVSVWLLLLRMGKHQQEELEKYLNARFQTEAEGRATQKERIEAQDEKHTALEGKVNLVNEQLLTLRAEIPEKYVRREDYIRGQTLLESKLDGLALRLENLQLRRGDD